MSFPHYIDLHMHSTVSDGTNTPAELLELVQKEHIALFSLTDHDAIRGGVLIAQAIREKKQKAGQTGTPPAGEDPEALPAFLSGVEFSCRDEDGKYHILGYGYDADSPAIHRVVKTGHDFRMKKLRARLEFIQNEFGFVFTKEEIDGLYEMDNPGKPHIAALMVKHGYVKDIAEAFKKYLGILRFQSEYVAPQDAIAGILEAGGIPVLAHPAYGSGDELIVGDEMNARLQKLIGFGLQGVEAYYSGFTDKIREEMLRFARQYQLYVTAGSDYHGTNKIIVLGDTGCEDAARGPEGMQRFLEEAKKLPGALI